MSGNNASRGRTSKTRGVNDRLLRANGRTPADSDPQALLTEEAVREFIRACMCPYCPAGPFKALASHTNSAHGIDRHELRSRAGMFEHESIASPEYRAACQAVAIEGDASQHIAAYSASIKGKKLGSRDLSDLARAKIALNLAAYNASLSTEERIENARKSSLSVPPESRKRQGAALREWHKQNPKSPEVAAARIAALHTAESRAKAAAASASRKQGHGTAASYKHRGCRCDPCKAAKHATRKDLKGGVRRGEQHGAATVSDVQLAELRRLAADGVPQRTLAVQFGISEATCSRFVRNLSRPATQNPATRAPGADA